MIIPSDNIFIHFLKSSLSFHQFHQQFPSQVTNKQIQTSLRNKTRDLLFGLEGQLKRINQIQSMKLYDNFSEEMLNKLINLHSILSKEHLSIIIEEEKQTVLRFSKVQLKTKMNMYSRLLNYAEKQQLFSHALKSKEQVKDIPPYENPSSMYSLSELQLICTLYQRCNGDYNLMHQKLKLKDHNFQQGQLQTNLQNLQLIGLYQCYRKSVESLGFKPMSWSVFLQDQAEYRGKMMNWSKNLMIVLMKMAIRGKATPNEIRRVCSRLKRTYHDSQFRKKDKKKKIVKQYTEEQKQTILQELKMSLKQILKQKKH